MFIRKKEYEKLYEELKVTKKKCEEFELQTRSLKEKLNNYESKVRRCDEMCQGCRNLIEVKEEYYPSDLYGRVSLTPRERTIGRCALDRTCKDFKAKESGNNE